MDDFIRLRSRIDVIDDDILRLLKRRCETARQLGQLKQARAIDIRDPKRERAIVQRARTAATKLGLNPRRVKHIFNEIVGLSVEAQSLQRRDSSGRLRGKNLLAVGGTGEMGRFFIRLARTNGATVRIVGRDPKQTRRAAREMAVEAGTLEDAVASDIVVVSVPINLTKKISIQVASHMQPGSLLMDLSSVKTGIADQIFASTPESIEYVSMHPLFGPHVDSLDGQNIAVIPYRIGRQWRVLSQTIRDEGARFSLVTSKNHDEAMALVQVLHHFALLCLGESIGDWDGRLTTSSMRRTLETIQRLLSNWDTIAGIQLLNPYAEVRRRQFVTVVKNAADRPMSSQSERRLTAHVQKWSRKL